MTRRVGNVLIIEDEPDKRCSRCGKLDECRDVRGDGKQVCYGCATPEDFKAYERILFGCELN